MHPVQPCFTRDSYSGSTPASQAGSASSILVSRSMLVESEYVKIQVAVPVANEAAILDAFGKHGAGRQGTYSYCSGTYRAIGRFIPLDGSHPAIGTLGKLEQVEESVVQAICHRDNVERVIIAVKKVHPYEEPAIDIMPRFDLQ